jgi:hypothetical protein
MDARAGVRVGQLSQSRSDKFVMLALFARIKLFIHDVRVAMDWMAVTSTAVTKGQRRLLDLRLG